MISRTLPAILLLSCLCAAQNSSRFNAGNGTRLPVYPRAVPSEHQDDRGTVSVDGIQVSRLAGNAYISRDAPGKVLDFYRQRLRGAGQVTECTGGRNTLVDVQLDQESFANPGACDAEKFAENGVELKVANGSEQKIVVVLPHGSGSEIALVSAKQ